MTVSLNSHWISKNHGNKYGVYIIGVINLDTILCHLTYEGCLLSWDEYPPPGAPVAVYNYPRLTQYYKRDVGYDGVSRLPSRVWRTYGSGTI